MECLEWTGTRWLQWVHIRNQGMFLNNAPDGTLGRQKQTSDPPGRWNSTPMTQQPEGESLNSMCSRPCVLGKNAQHCFQDKEMHVHMFSFPSGAPSIVFKEENSFYHMSREICLFLNGFKPDRLRHAICSQQQQPQACSCAHYLSSAVCSAQVAHPRIPLFCVVKVTSYCSLNQSWKHLRGNILVADEMKWLLHIKVEKEFKGGRKESAWDQSRTEMETRGIRNEARRSKGKRRNAS